MKVIYAADIHGGFDRAQILPFETVADRCIVAGDLIDIPFCNMNTAINHCEFQLYFHGMSFRMNTESAMIGDFVDELLDMPGLSAEAVEKGAKCRYNTPSAPRLAGRSRSQNHPLIVTAN